ncbi:hypothetical protein PVK06_031678 [Gossypium arboreum]|uniref:Aminotransferase-like plant mobile domain-containing protein n=1 Tax=Gossypium arboreum TaxID=29729 RepID=A0ABR0NRN7_GOSAR|nr:hypothetical protein PVK06_031678 [Gossypium arboreum]
MLVKRWKPKTHTYHLLCGECTITLNDVALKLGLSVDDSAVTRSTVVRSKEDLCKTFLGKVSNKFYSHRINMKLLETNFKDLPKDAPNVIKEQNTRSFILRLIGGILMPNKSQNLVRIRWLLHLVDFKEIIRLSWGSTVLATLYRELCRTTKPNKMSISGCLLLLQSWVWWRLPFLRLQVNDPYMFPLVTR